MTLSLGLEGAQGGEGPRPWTVRQLVETARDAVETVPMVWVEGEVANFKTWSGGQWYFALKDRHASVGCVVWADDVRRHDEPPVDGVKVLAQGYLTVFPRRGQLQFVVRRVFSTRQGGAAALRLEQARASLEKDGLLAPERKRALPYMPRRIAVVTSPEGAVWHDIVSVVARRWPLCQLVLVGARVQGAEAPRELARALERAGRLPSLDLIIVARGGGSKDDLLAFNEEVVARAVAGAGVPVISAVGHETDVTLTDMVADHRAPTPSAAAEAAVPDRAELLEALEHLRARLDHSARGRHREADARIRHTEVRLAALVERRVLAARHLVDGAVGRMAGACDRRLALGRARADRAGAALEALSPLRVLERGYAVAQGADGRVLRRAADLPAGRAFRLRLADGDVPARAEAS